MNRAIAFVLLILISVNSFAASDIENRFDEYIVAFTGQDIEAVKTFLSPNGFTMNAYSGKVEEKEEWLGILEARNENFRKGVQSLNIIVNAKKVSVNGNSAQIIGVYTWNIGVTESNIFKTQEAKINFLQTWEKINNVWFLTNITNSKIQEPNKSYMDSSSKW